MDRLLKTQEEFAFAATAAMAGRTVRVLVEAAGRNEGTVNGRLDNNLVVEFKAPESLIGQWADVHITGSRARCWWASLLNKPTATPHNSRRGKHRSGGAASVAKCSIIHKYYLRLSSYHLARRIGT